MSFISFCPVLYLIFFSTLKTKSLFETDSQSKEVNKAEGWCEEMSWREGMWSKCPKRGENWQRGILPHLPGKLLPERQAEPQRTIPWPAPAFWGCRGTWQLRDNVTDLLCPLLCDLWERSSLSVLHWIPGLSAQAPTGMSGYGRCVGCIDQADLHPRNGLRTFWVTLSPPGRKHLDGLLIPTEIWWT